MLPIVEAPVLIIALAAEAVNLVVIIALAADSEGLIAESVVLIALIVGVRAVPFGVPFLIVEALFLTPFAVPSPIEEQVRHPLCSFWDAGPHAQRRRGPGRVRPKSPAASWRLWRAELEASRRVVPDRGASPGGAAATKSSDDAQLLIGAPFEADVIWAEAEVFVFGEG